MGNTKTLFYKHSTILQKHSVEVHTLGIIRQVSKTYLHAKEQC